MLLLPVYCRDSVFVNKQTNIVDTSTSKYERVFSKLGLLLNKKRLCMSTSNVDKVLFVSDKI